MGLADVFRPLAAVSYQAQLQMTLESVWCAAYNLRRIVVPRRPLFANPVDRVAQIMRQVD